MSLRNASQGLWQSNEPLTPAREPKANYPPVAFQSYMTVRLLGFVPSRFFVIYEKVFQAKNAPQTFIVFRKRRDSLNLGASEKQIPISY